MRSRGPGMSPSRDRVSSYVGPAFVKCATVSLVPPSSGGNHWTVAVSHLHVRISATRSMLAVWSRSQGGRGVPGGARTRRPPILYGASGPPATILWYLHPKGAQGLPHESP